MSLPHPASPPAAPPTHAGDASYFSLIDAVSTPMLLHRDGRIVFVNSALERLSGFASAELLGAPYDTIAHADSRRLLRERGESRRQGESVPPRCEFRLNTRNGRECWVELTVSNLDIGGVATVIGSFYDLTERKLAEATQRDMQQLLAQIIDGDPVPTLVIDVDHKVTHWNKACAMITGVAAEEVIGTDRHWAPFYPSERPLMADLIVSGDLAAGADKHYEGKARPSQVVEGGFECVSLFPHFGDSGRWLYFTAAPLRDTQGRMIGAIETLQDVTDREIAENELRQHQSHLEQIVAQRTTELASANRQMQEDIRRRETAEAELLAGYRELSELNERLSDAQAQLLQSEKLASIGQLAAGVAHEINNPIGYVHSNIGALESYLGDLFRLLDTYESTAGAVHERMAALRSLRSEIDVDFLREDIPLLMRESKEGISRVRKIVQDLKDFSRVDSTQEWQWAKLHDGIDSTVNIVANEIKYKADVVREYGQLPEVECLPSQLNQVFMNLLVNSAHAMGDERGCITIRTGVAGDRVWLEFADNGSGIPDNIKQKIFDPFFTTKPVGKGTGLGLSLSYGIIQNHNGRIELESEPGKGSCFRIVLPIQHATDGEQEK